MAYIMCERARFDEVAVQSKTRADRGGKLEYFDTVGEPLAQLIVIRGGEELGLIAKSVFKKVALGQQLRVTSGHGAP
jgi:hypothetical protein